MKQIKNILSIVAAVLLLSTSCTKVDELSTTPDVVAGEEVSVSLNLSVTSLSAGTEEAANSLAQTRSNGTEDEISTYIKNLWVIQINGTEESSSVVGLNYYGLYTDETEITLLSSSTNNRIVLLANTFASSLGLTVGTSTYADVLATKWTNSSEEKYYTTDDENTKYYIMSGYDDVTVSNETEVDANLKRSIAKIIFNVDNQTDSGLTITSIKLCNVPSYGYYLTDLDDYTLANSYQSGISTFDFDSREIDNGVAGTSSISETFYMPTNIQGTNASSSYEALKPLYATTSSTYVSVYAEGDGDSEYYRYNFYLGENLTTDYNILPNNQYEYTITFNSVGSVSSDPRITDLGMVDLRTESSSNCYILNPSTTNDRTYIIPIEERIVDFWTNYAGSSYKTISLTSTDDWEYEVLWYDCDSDPIDGESALTIAQFPESDLGEALQITIPQSYTNYGNIVVAVKSKNSGSVGSILWSWHLWLTDYNPDSRTHSAGDAGAYLVDGGAIHRYDGTIWETGVYADKFIMDRNLGARNATDYAGSGKGALYYQWGSKNPIPGTGANFTDGYSGTTSTSPILTGTSDGETFATVTQNPTTHYFINDSGDGDNGYNWCCEDVSLSADYCFWNDYQCSTTSDYTTKSIFDPSPFGWMLPINGTWVDFTTGSTSVDGTTTYPNFPWGTYSRTYLEFAYYPASGCRSNASGELGNVGSSGYSWSATPSSSTYGYFLYFLSTNVYPAYSNYRSYGRPVRPIQE